MGYLIIGLFACMLAGWVWSEYKLENPSARIALGSVVILMLGAVLCSLQLRSIHHDTHNSAAFRMLGEALDDGDFESARRAIQFG